MGFAGPHLDPLHKDLFHRVGLHVWLETLRNLPKQMRRQLLFHGWSSLAMSQGVTVFFFMFFSPFLHDHDWSTVERVFLKYMFSKRA